MSVRRYTVREALDHIFEEGEASEETDQAEIEEDVSEDDFVEHDPHQDEDTSDSDGEVGLNEPEQGFVSKNGKVWSSIPYENEGRATSANIIKMTPGPTRFAKSHVQDIKTAFELFIPNSIQSILIEMTNLEGRKVFGHSWEDIDGTKLDAYFGVLLLAGVYRCVFCILMLISCKF